MLLPSKTDQDWFHDIISNDFKIVWIRKRLKFKNNKDSAMGGHLLVMICEECGGLDNDHDIDCSFDV